MGNAAHRAGDSVGAYRLHALIGTGSTASVWAARHVDDDAEVALKVLHPKHTRAGGTRGPSAADRFVHEARVRTRLRIPGLVELFDVIDERPEGAVALVLERLHGEDLGRAAAGLSLEATIDVFAEVARILCAIHVEGIIHRDVKPDNIFLCEPAAPGASRPVKLLDLGIAKDLVMPAVAESTATGVVIGTIQTMAPESVDRISGDDVALTGAVDQWGLGVSLYAAVCGRTPFEAEGLWPLLRAIKSDPTPPLQLLPRFGVAGPPQSLLRFVGRCLAKDPAARFGAMDELAAALDVVREEVRQTGHEAPPQPRSATAEPRTAEPTVFDRPGAGLLDEPETLVPEPEIGAAITEIHPRGPPRAPLADEAETLKAAPPSPPPAASRRVLLLAIAITIATALLGLLVGRLLRGR